METIKKILIPSFIFLLLLFSLIPINNVNATQPTSLMSVEETGIGIGPYEWGGNAQQFTIPVLMKPNSYIHTYYGKWFGYGAGFGFSPGGCKWILTCNGKVKYQFEGTGQYASAPDVPSWWPFPYPNVFVFNVEAPTDVRIPAFAESGSWKLSLYLYDKAITSKTACVAEWTCSVSSGGVFDNLLAPIYLHIDMGIIGGTYDLALPGLFWLTCPIWGILGSIIIFKYWMTSLQGSKNIFKSSKIKFFRGGKKNE